MPIPGNKKAMRISAKNIVYQTVCDWIITGVLKPGEKIADGELAEYFNVSRTPVREALQILQNQKLVQIKPGKITEVTEINVGDIEKCYLPLAEIQGLAAGMACRNISEKDLQKLEAEDRLFAQACEANDGDAALERDARFHEIITDAADNDYIEDFVHTLLLHVQRVKYYYFHKDLVRLSSAIQHREILDAIKARDSALAQELMRSHWLYVMERARSDIQNHIEYTDHDASGALAE